MIKKDKTRHYVDNELLYTQMVDFVNLCNIAKANGEQRPQIPNSIGIAIKKIAEKLSTSRSFALYSYRDEMISDGIENCILYLHNFNGEKYKSPFTYFTTIIYYAFLRRISKEKKEQYIRSKMTINSSIFNSLVDMPDGDSSHFTSSFLEMDADKMQELVDKFEKSSKDKKKAPKKGLEKFIEEDTDES